MLLSVPMLLLIHSTFPTPTTVFSIDTSNINSTFTLKSITNATNRNILNASGIFNAVTNELYPPEVNHTALAFLLRQFQRHQQCGVKSNGNASGIIEKQCDERTIHRTLMGYGFLILFCLAIIGNCINFFICNSDQIRFYNTIQMLCTKLLVNTLTMTFLVPQAFRIINSWKHGSSFDLFYWKFWPYQAYFTNVFGFCAMWLTVLMTAECYLYIFFPSQSKVLCTKHNLLRSYLLVGFTGLFLALIYPLNRTVKFKWHCSNLFISIEASQSEIMAIIERVHTVVNLLLAIIVPLTLLIYMTASIVWRFIIRPIEFGNSGSGLNHFGFVTSQHFSVEKRGVTRITLITTLLQLISETPSVLVLISAMLFGPNITQSLCTWQTISHFLGLCNASLSFFVYLTFSNRFRNSIIRRAKLLFLNLSLEKHKFKQNFPGSFFEKVNVFGNYQKSKLNVSSNSLNAPFNSSWFNNPFVYFFKITLRYSFKLRNTESACLISNFGVKPLTKLQQKCKHQQLKSKSLPDTVISLYNKNGTIVTTTISKSFNSHSESNKLQNLNENLKESCSKNDNSKRKRKLFNKRTMVEFIELTKLKTVKENIKTNFNSSIALSLSTSSISQYDSFL